MPSSDTLENFLRCPSCGRVYLRPYDGVGICWTLGCKDPVLVQPTQEQMDALPMGCTISTPTILRPEQEIRFRYVNWKGEEGIRRAIPIGLFWGSNEYHPIPQHLMRAYDCDKNALRIFALLDIKEWLTMARPQLSPEEEYNLLSQDAELVAVTRWEL
jgi:hypothetical protein